MSLFLSLLPPPCFPIPSVTVARAIAAFTVEFESYAAEATRKKYKRLMKRVLSDR